MKKVNKYVVITVAVALISLMAIIPILKLSKYNVLENDDFSFSYNVAHTWQDTKSIVKTIKAAMIQSKNTYFGWQGTFSAIFLFALQPGIVGMQYYSLTTYILLFTFIISNLILYITIARKVFKIKNLSIPIILALLTSVVAVEYVPEARESLYWWNGSIYYTFFYSICLVELALMINYIMSKADRVKDIIKMIGISLIAIFLSGGNYATCLAFAVTFFCIIAFLLFKNRRNKRNWLLLIPFVLYLIGFAINMMAPGNDVRQSACDNSLGPVKSIITSTKYAIGYIDKWTTLPLIIVFTFATPFIYRMIKNRKYNFKYPLVFSVATFGIFISQFVPPIYAMNNLGGARLLDILYYSYYLLMMVNIMYYIGWAFNKFGEIKLLEYALECKIIFSIIILLIITTILVCSESYKSTTTFKAQEQISSGDAQKYYKEACERFEQYLSDESDIVVKEFSVKPEFLYGGDVTEDKNNWVNHDIAQYFRKNSVVKRVE